MRAYFKRHTAPFSLRRAITVGLGSMIAIGIIAAITTYAHIPLLIAPFGASCVLLFALPSSPLAQPAHVVGGHVITALVGVLLHAILPDSWWAVALAAGCAISAMAMFGVIHPPAGANPIVIFASHASASFVLVPVLAGALILVLVAAIFHKLDGAEYPAHPQ